MPFKTADPRVVVLVDVWYFPPNRPPSTSVRVAQCHRRRLKSEKCVVRHTGYEQPLLLAPRGNGVIVSCSQEALPRFTTGLDSRLSSSSDWGSPWGGSAFWATDSWRW